MFLQGCFREVLRFCRTGLKPPLQANTLSRARWYGGLSLIVLEIFRIESVILEVRIGHHLAMEVDGRANPFDLELVATPAQGSTIEETSARIDSRLHWFWTTPGVVPESSPDLRTWTERPDLASPILVEPTPSGPAREFFRLKIPTQKTNG